MKFICLYRLIVALFLLIFDISCAATTTTSATVGGEGCNVRSSACLDSNKEGREKESDTIPFWQFWRKLNVFKDVAEAESTGIVDFANNSRWIFLQDSFKQNGETKPLFQNNEIIPVTMGVFNATELTEDGSMKAMQAVIVVGNVIGFSFVVHSNNPYQAEIKVGYSTSLHPPSNVKSVEAAINDLLNNKAVATLDPETNVLTFASPTTQISFIKNPSPSAIELSGARSSSLSDVMKLSSANLATSSLLTPWFVIPNSYILSGVPTPLFLNNSPFPVQLTFTKQANNTDNIYSGVIRVDNVLRFDLKISSQNTQHPDIINGTISNFSSSRLRAGPEDRQVEEALGNILRQPTSSLSINARGDRLVIRSSATGSTSTRSQIAFNKQSTDTSVPIDPLYHQYLFGFQVITARLVARRQTANRYICQLSIFNTYSFYLEIAEGNIIRFSDFSRIALVAPAAADSNQNVSGNDGQNDGQNGDSGIGGGMADKGLELLDFMNSEGVAAEELSSALVQRFTTLSETSFINRLRFTKQIFANPQESTITFKHLLYRITFTARSSPPFGQTIDQLPTVLTRMTTELDNNNYKLIGGVSRNVDKEIVHLNPAEGIDNVTNWNLISEGEGGSGLMLLLEGKPVVMPAGSEEGKGLTLKLREESTGKFTGELIGAASHTFGFSRSENKKEDIFESVQGDTKMQISVGPIVTSNTSSATEEQLRGEKNVILVLQSASIAEKKGNKLIFKNPVTHSLVAFNRVEKQIESPQKKITFSTPDESISFVAVSPIQQVGSLSGAADPLPVLYHQFAYLFQVITARLTLQKLTTNNYAGRLTIFNTYSFNLQISFGNAIRFSNFNLITFDEDGIETIERTNVLSSNELDRKSPETLFLLAERLFIRKLQLTYMISRLPFDNAVTFRGVLYSITFRSATSPPTITLFKPEALLDSKNRASTKKSTLSPKIDELIHLNSLTDGDQTKWRLDDGDGLIVDGNPVVVVTDSDGGKSITLDLGVDSKGQFTAILEGVKTHMFDFTIIPKAATTEKEDEEDLTDYFREDTEVQIVIGPVVTIEDGEENDSVEENKGESEIIAVLQSVVTARKTGNKLVLRNASGSDSITFNRVVS